jgi:hypothetical protein
MPKITYERLHQVLRYDSITGIFHWRISVSGVKIGDEAGSLGNGYIYIGIDGILYLAHRLAWLYVYGYFPENNLDHRDRIRHHNWIKNLREATQQCNSRNCGNHKDNKSGVKGVYWNKEENKWHARIMVAPKRHHLGYYINFYNAVCARLAAEQCLNWANCDSSSPAYKYVQNMLDK